MLQTAPHRAFIIVDHRLRRPCAFAIVGPDVFVPSRTSTARPGYRHEPGAALITAYARKRLGASRAIALVAGIAFMWCRHAINLSAVSVFPACSHSRCSRPGS
jgi:hypothetical protein